MSDTYTLERIRRNAGAGSGIKNARGTLISLTDASHDMIPRLNIYGRSTQNGTPTLESNVPIMPGNTAEYIPTIRVSKTKNILAEVAQTETKNGVTCVNNGDGTYTINGTATANAYFYIYTNQKNLYNGQYRLVGAPAGGGSGKYRLIAEKSNAAGTDFSSIANDYGEGANVTFAANTGYSLIIGIYKGYAAKDLVFKPMLTLDAAATYEDFEPYEGCQKIVLDDWFRGIPVASGGNYTDENGQQWLCDTIEINEDGTCNYVQNLQLLTLDGSSDENWNKDSFFYLVLPTSASASIHEVLCTFSPYKYSASGDGAFISKTRFTIGNANPAATTYATVDAWREFLKTNPQQILYALATPKKLDMNWFPSSAAKLHSYDPNTTITADGAFIDVDYVPNYIANDTRYFQINGIPSSDFGIKVQSPPKIGELEPVYERTHIKGRNGDILRATGEFSNRDIDIKCYHLSRYPQEQMPSIDSYLLKQQGYVNLWFPDDYSHYWKAAVTKTGERATRCNWLNPFDISFTAMPQAFLVEGGVMQTVYTGKSTDDDTQRPFYVTNTGNQDGKPLFKITGKGEIIISTPDEGYLHFIIPSSGVLWFDFYTENAYADEEQVLTTAIEYRDKITFPAESTVELRVEGHAKGDYVTKIEVVGRWFDI